MVVKKLPSQEWDYPHRVTTPAYRAIHSMYQDVLSEDELDQLLSHMEHGRGSFYSVIMLGRLLEHEITTSNDPKKRSKLIDDYFSKMPSEFTLDYYLTFVNSKDH
ncbi:MAG: hypothetical protein ACJ0QU_00215 [Halobacteriales archaeon]|tara:strand:+ start:616 stop:930 length:315 start_codon:yes stop_codon:yes gene_type:complete